MTDTAPIPPPIQPSTPTVPPWQRWLVYSPLARIVIFGLLTASIGAIVGFAGRMAGIPVGERVPFDKVGPLLQFCRLLPIVLAYWLLVRFIERRRVDEMAAGKLIPHVVAGIVGGAVVFSLIIGVLWLLGCYHVNGINHDVSWLGPILVLGFGAGIGEEIISRGVLFRIVEEGMGTWFALVLSALFFGGMHIWNPNATAWSSLAIALEAGLLFGLLFHITRSLWMCMGLHAAWNVMQGPIYGIPVSGFEQHGLLASSMTGPTWLNGGSFGAEASAVAVITCSIIIAVLLAVALRRGSIVPPFWARSQPISAALQQPPALRE
jgi:membrane protease YdiL (CAAX protease family)